MSAPVPATLSRGQKLVLGTKISRYLLARTFQRPIYAIKRNRVNFLMFASTVSVAAACWFSVRRISPGCVGLLINDGKAQPHVFDGGMLLITNPLRDSYVSMRLSPVLKRFIRTYKTVDGKDIEIHMRCALKIKLHWAPEIWQTFGRDFGRGFLEKEFDLDAKDVLKKYTFIELTHRRYADLQMQIIEELKERIGDACSFHHLELKDAHELEIEFRSPQF
ncbi:unnamed protein product [Amoebophrya sp. A120]|nr:unnamed protein product [Amoebophrya sp. A120]|eukprot:GSA120T00017626001.1